MNPAPSPQINSPTRFDFESRISSDYSYPVQNFGKKSSLYPETPVLKPHDIIELYPGYNQNLNNLRQACAGLMQGLNKSEHLKPKNNKTVQPEIEELNESVLNTRETLNTVLPQSTCKEFNPFVPERQENLAQEVKKLQDAIRKLADALACDLGKVEPPLPEICVKSQNLDGKLDVNFNKDKIRELIDAAIDLDEIVKAGRNISMDDSSLFDFGASQEKKKEKSPLLGEKANLQKEFESSRKKFLELSKIPRSKKWLNENNPLDVLAENINSEADSINYVHEPTLARQQLEKSLEDFINLSQSKLIDNQDISEIADVNPTQRSLDTSAFA